MADRQLQDILSSDEITNIKYADDILATHTSNTSNPHNVTASQVNAYETTEFINSSSGAADAGKPIVLDGNGQIDVSMLDTSTFYYVGPHDPSGGTEYPDTTGESHGAFWVVDTISAPNNGDNYDFQAGELAGKTISVGDFMVWGTGGWGIMAGEMNPTLYYKLDGTQALTAPFAGGGQVISNIADGSTDNDAATVGQLNAKVGNDTDSFTSVPEVTQIVTLTQAEYDVLTPDANTMYLIVG